MTTGGVLMATTLRLPAVRASTRLLLPAGIAVVMLFVSLAVVAAYVRNGSLGADAGAYWHTGHRAGAMYGLRPGQPTAYLYSPAFAQLVKPLTLLPLRAFEVLWCAGEAAVFAWLIRPAGLRWGLPLFLLCAPEIALGNVYGFYAAALVIGIRRPAAWTLPVLTKITPGIGVVWFAARREWRSLAVVLGASLAIALVSFAIAPGEWWAWFRFLRSGDGRPLAAIRLAVAVLITLAAARLDARWLLPFAMVLACPLLHETTLSIFAAVPRLAAMDRQIGMPQPRQGPSVQYAST